MTFYVDANIIVYAASDDPRRETCGRLIEGIADGGALGLTSTAALEELWHVELRTNAALEGLTRWAYGVFAPLLAVTDAIVRRALELDLPGSVGSNDRIHAATCLENDIDVMLSADSGFDHVRGLRRVDPLEARAVQRLLRSGRR